MKKKRERANPWFLHRSAYFIFYVYFFSNFDFFTTSIFSLLWFLPSVWCSCKSIFLPFEVSPISTTMKMIGIFFFIPHHFYCFITVIVKIWTRVLLVIWIADILYKLTTNIWKIELVENEKRYPWNLLQMKWTKLWNILMKFGSEKKSRKK